MILDLDGKQVVVGADLGRIWLQLFANGGSIGVELTAEQAQELGLRLFRTGRRVRRGVADTFPRMKL